MRETIEMVRHDGAGDAARRRRDGERGASLVEYALLVALIAVVCIGAVTFLGTGASGKIDKAGSAIAGEDKPYSCSSHFDSQMGVDVWMIYDVEQGNLPVAGPGPGTCADAEAANPQYF